MITLLFTNIIGDCIYIIDNTIHRTTMIIIKHRRNDFNIEKSGFNDAYIKFNEKHINNTHDITNNVKLFAGIPSKKFNEYVII